MGQNLPTIGITMGDPCGIGPEVIAKALADQALRARANFLVLGFSELFTYAADLAELDFPWYRDHHDACARPAGGVVVLDYDELPAPPVGVHEPTRYGGKSSVTFVEDAVRMAQSGLLDAIVTAPISKQAWRMAGVRFPGHTELLAKRTKTRHYAMMFAAPRLRVVLATIHVSMMEMLNHFTIGCVFNPIDLADRALKELFGIPNPRIAVCGLNPHAGEEGRFGDEEQRIIAPAILMASEGGANVSGPYPADTLFRRATQGEFDCVVAMYHDQGLIPMKLLAWREAVNLTLGLPIIRTSPPHGTAYDIAGKDKADAEPMRSAIALAVELAEKRLLAVAGGQIKKNGPAFQDDSRRGTEGAEKETGPREKGTSPRQGR